MYKVFFNRTELLIVDKQEFSILNGYYNHQVEIAQLPTKDTALDWLNKDEELTYVLKCISIEDSWQEFARMFKNIAAAGGLVFNENNELLTIYRNSYWDLPKGKVEKDETILFAAKREVEEETGIVVKTVNENSCRLTYHVYMHKEKLILKNTAWFFMSAESTVLVPQVEEGITEVRWMTKIELDEIFSKKTYATSINLLNSALVPNQSRG